MTRRVKVHAMTLGLPEGVEPTEWFACCTEADWSLVDPRTGELGLSCNWYGGYRSSRAEAKADAARHRRTHRAVTQ